MMTRIVAYSSLMATLIAAPAWAGRLDAPFTADRIVDGLTLARITGKADAAMAVQAQNTSTVVGNFVTGNPQTGKIVFDQAAFQNMAGLTLLSANTGNNVAINASLNVNVSMHAN